MTEITIIIDPEFEALIPPLAKEELEGLERDLERDGCRDALVVWPQEGGDVILLDGHNRYEICRRHALSYVTKVLDLPSRDHAKRWLLDNQLNRRNLSPTQRAALAAERANLPARRPAQTAQICAVCQSEGAKRQSV